MPYKKLRPRAYCFNGDPHHLFLQMTSEGWYIFCCYECNHRYFVERDVYWSLR